MSPADRSQRRRQRTHQRLLDAAEQVFSEKGFQEATILDITETADVSKRTFYLHFDDKQTLIEALALRAFQELRNQIEAKEGHDDHDSFEGGFKLTVTTIFEFAEQNPELMQVIFGEDGSYRLRQITHEFTALAYAENFSQKCNWAPDAKLPPDILSYAISGVIHQLLGWWVNTPNDYSPAEMAAMCTSIFYDDMGDNFESLDHPTQIAIGVPTEKRDQTID